jgi:hypothetical protein
MSDVNLTPQPSDQSLTRFQSRAPELLQQVRAISVIDDASYVQACEYKLVAAELLKTVKTITDQIKRTHKAALDSSLIPWERIAAPIEEAVALAERKRKEYRDEQERRLVAQQAEVLRLAQERADADRQRNADLLKAAGHEKAAAQVLQAPLNVAPVVLPPAVPKVKGIRNAKTWKVRVTDPVLFVRAVGAAVILASDDLALDDFTKNLLRIISGGVSPEALAVLFKDGDPANLHWLRDKAIQQKEAFVLPGVAAWQE